MRRCAVITDPTPAAGRPPGGTVSPRDLLLVAARDLARCGWSAGRDVDPVTGHLDVDQALRFAAGGTVGAGRAYASEPDDAPLRDSLRAAECRLLGVLADSGELPAHPAERASATLERWEAVPGRRPADVLRLFRSATSVTGSV